MNGEIIFKCFKTPGGCYIYDRHTNSVLRVNGQEYAEFLKAQGDLRKAGESAVVKKYRHHGMFKENEVEEITHPETEYLSHLSQNCMAYLILQVTQQCNLRCGYCAYSGNYFNRRHSSQRMTFETARRAIDFYLGRTSESDGIEPVINRAKEIARPY